MNRVKPSFWIFLCSKTLLPVNVPQPLLLILAILTFGNLWSNLSTDTSDNPQLLYCIKGILLATVLMLVFLLFYEWNKFQEMSSVYKNGADVNGEVVLVYFSGGFEIIMCVYEFQNEKFSSTDSIIRRKNPPNFSVGQKVAMYVNQKQPRQAFIRDLYLDTFQPITNH